MDNFIEYMWYLLTTPFKKVKKSLNAWYTLCKVIGKRFDEAKEAMLRTRDEGMVATCSDEMLPVHGADRRLSRYQGEHPDNYRSRIAMYAEICQLGGLNEGIILAVKSLGYTNPVIRSARDFKGDTDRWAEFYLIIVMNTDEEHPIGFNILRKTVRQWKEVEAKDNYYMEYKTSIKEPHTSAFPLVEYKKFIYFYDYLKLDGKWQLDGSHMMDALIYIGRIAWAVRYILQHIQEVTARQRYRLKPIVNNHDAGNGKEAYKLTIDYFDYLKLNGLWSLTGSRHTDSQRMEYPTTQSYRTGVENNEDITVTWHEEHNLFFLDGEWSLDGSKILDAYQKTEVM